MPLMPPRASDGKLPLHETFRQEHWGGCKTAAAVVLAQRAPWGGLHRQYRCPTLTWQKTFPQTVHEHACELPRDRTERVRKSITWGGQKSMKRLTNSPQKSHDAHARSSDGNFRYKIYHLPYTRQCFLSFTEILYRGWEDCLCLCWADCKTSNGRCSAIFQKTDAEWDKQRGKISLKLSQHKGTFFLITAQ